jgi:N-acyl-D-aspartate/D-glutamate deacylase
MARARLRVMADIGVKDGVIVKVGTIDAKSQD